MSHKSIHSNIGLTRWQSILLRATVIPMAALVASHLIFSQILPGQPGYRFPWLYFLTVATVMSSCWGVNLFIFRWLDERLPFWQNPGRRLVYQLLLGGSATLLTFALVFPLAQQVYGHQWPAFPIIVKGVVVCVTLATLVNGGYVGFYLLRAFWIERQKNTYPISNGATPETVSRLSSDSSLVIVEVSNGQLRLPAEHIAYFYSTGGLVLLIKTDGQQIATDYSSFAQFTPDLDKNQFFQLSRQFVVSTSAVRAVRDDVNRKRIVTLVPALHRQDTYQEVVVSRYRSVDFRKWLDATSSP